jgi:hypothetical protein
VGYLLLEAGHSDLEELVEVRCPDRQELDLLEKREVGSGGEIHDPLVELEPGQLSIQIMLWIEGFHGVTYLTEPVYRRVNARS